MPSSLVSGDWWALYDNGLLDIYCVGDMPTFSSPDSVPWRRWRDSVMSAHIHDSVTSISDYAFYLCGITDVYYDGTSAQWNAITIGKYNTAQNPITIHYNSTGS